MEGKRNSVVRIPSFGDFTRESVLGLPLALVSPEHSKEIKKTIQRFLGGEVSSLGDLITIHPDFFKEKKGGLRARALLAWLLSHFGMGFGIPSEPDSINPTPYFRENDFPTYGDWLTGFYHSCGKKIIRAQEPSCDRNTGSQSSYLKKGRPSCQKLPPSACRYGGGRDDDL